MAQKRCDLAFFLIDKPFGFDPELKTTDNFLYFFASFSLSLKSL